MLQLQLHRAAEEEAAERLMKLGQAEAAGAAAERRARALEAQLHEAREQGRAHAEVARAQRRQLHQQAQAAWQAWARCEAPASGGGVLHGGGGLASPSAPRAPWEPHGSPPCLAARRGPPPTRCHAGGGGALGARCGRAHGGEPRRGARRGAAGGAAGGAACGRARRATLARARPSSPDRLGSLNSRAPLPPTSWQARCCARRARGRR